MLSPQRTFEGRVAFITGAASGVGRATAVRVAAVGGVVACFDINREGLADTVNAIRDVGGTALALTGDVTDPKSVDVAIEEASLTFGAVHAVANIAGVGDFTGDVVETSPQVWGRVLAVNLTGPYNVSRSAVPQLAAAGGGAIVNVSSVFGLVGCLASPAYCASKAGLIGLTRAMAIDHAAIGIRVNCVCPGPVDTPMLARVAETPAMSTREEERSRHRNALGRPSSPEEIAAAVVFLLSPENGSTTGTVLTVDGGWIAG